MANSKISALTSAATVAGTEVLPIVQSSATVKVAISDLNPGLSTILATKGGTGQTSYAVGDLLYASTTTALSKLADVATGNALISGGVGVAPSYGKIGLTTHVSGILPVANGGTNASTASITSFNNITGYTASGATGTTSTNLVFSTSPSVTTPTWIGNATLSTGNIIQGTAAKGFDFSANTPAAGKTSTVLNWYEEGTFTPTVIGSVTAGTATYAIQIGRYTRIGNRVFINLTLSYSAGTGTGFLRIAGLPFASNSTANNYQTMSAYVANVTLAALTICLPLIDAGKSEIYINQNAVGGGGDSNVTYDAAAFINISGQYQI
jgi:hypothetical protein